MQTDKVKAKIQSLCPDVMELKFGCAVEMFGIEYLIIQNEPAFLQLYPYKRDAHGLDGTHHLRKNSDDWKYLGVLGSPITLAVVLRAIGKNNLTWGWQMRLMGRYLNLDGKKGENWDLEHDNYDAQSQETKDFIGSLLQV